MRLPSLAPRGARLPLLVLAIALAAGALVAVRVHQRASPPPVAAHPFSGGASGPATPAAHHGPDR